MRKNLLSGLILLLPIAITVGLFIFLIDLLTTPFLYQMEHVLRFFGDHFGYDIEYHSTLMVVIGRIIILVFLFFFVLLLGFLANRIVFNWIVKFTHRIMLRIPLINLIYRLCKDIISAVLQGGSKFFSRVVIVPFPCSESRTIGLVTGNSPIEVQEKGGTENAGEVLKTVFVPTSPHPISGFLLFVKDKDLRSVDLCIEDVFKFLISCGIFTPPQDKECKFELGKDDNLPNQE